MSDEETKPIGADDIKRLFADDLSPKGLSGEQKIVIQTIYTKLDRLAGRLNWIAILLFVIACSELGRTVLR